MKCAAYYNIKCFLYFAILFLSLNLKAEKIDFAEFSKSIYFDLRSNASISNNFEFNYRMYAGGLRISFGPHLISSSVFNGQIIFNPEKHESDLKLIWPKDFFNPNISLIKNSMDKVIWSRKLTAPSLIGMEIISGDSELEAIFNDPIQYKICLKQEDSEYFTEICTPIIGVKTQKIPSVSINGKLSQSDNGIMLIHPKEKIHLKVELSDGLKIEQMITPSEFNLIELSDLGQNNGIRLVASGALALNAVYLNEELLLPEWVTGISLGKEQSWNTKYWKMSLVKGINSVNIPARGGGTFEYRVVVQDPLPNEFLTVKLHNTTPEDSYSESPQIDILSNPKNVFDSKQRSIQQASKNSPYFKWVFENASAGFYNRSYIEVTNDEDKKLYHGFYDIYRDYGNELSIRMSGMLEQNGLGYIGEFMYTHWFEDMNGWSNELFSTQRWGVNAKYLHSVEPISISNSQKVDFVASSLDLKYRFTPGVFLHTKTMGTMISYQSIAYGPFLVPMVGVGWFWSRGLPSFLEPVFNLIPYFRYSKYVDMEIIYYADSLDSNFKVSNSYAINFHGQILWSRNIFGEAGFGIKSYGFQKGPILGALTSIYGTMGLGYRF